MERGIEIEVVAGPEAGKRFVFRKRSVLLGRGSKADLKLDLDLKVSRRHAEIQRRRDGYLVVDRSSGGTFTDGNPIKRSTLQGGSVVKVGDSALRIGPSRIADRANTKELGLGSQIRARRLVLIASITLAILAALVMIPRCRPPNAMPPQSAQVPAELIERGEIEAAYSVLRAKPDKSDAEWEMYRLIEELLPRWRNARWLEDRMDFAAARDEWELAARSVGGEWIGVSNWIRTNRIEWIDETFPSLRNIGR